MSARVTGDCPKCGELGRVQPATSTPRRLIFAAISRLPLHCMKCHTHFSVLRRPVVLARLIDLILP